MGLLGEMSDDSEDDDDDIPATRAPPSAPTGKNRALYEAATRAEASPPLAVSSSNSVATPKGGMAANSSPLDPRQPAPSSADPRRIDARRPPGLTIPPASASQAQLDSSPRYPPTPNSQPVPNNVPPRTMARSPMPAPVPQHAPTSVARPMPAFMKPNSPAPPPSSPGGVPSSPAPPYPGMSPNSPMLAPMRPMELPPSTPITPLFAAPPTPDPSKGKVSFKDDMAPPIIRGGSEDTLLSRSPREKGYGSEGHGSDESYASTVGKGPRPQRNDGDDFWRRFSMVAHLAEDKKSTRSSGWLAKTEARSKSYSRWVWVLGLFLLLCAGGGIGYGVYRSRTSTSVSGPVAIGGKAEESNIAPTTSMATSTKHAKTGYNVQTVVTSDGSVIVLPTAGTKSPKARADIVEIPITYTGPTPTALPTPLAKHRRRLNRQLFD